ncbi:hypothetical protein NLU13_5462 [Sarocladium strictum]|uniref:Uncharacterized protein n=1 Tax=Sarocladium strictum TaxID=5046 RepID=A0AA39GHN4_SARSR|nr:hypothetical protein NLU13_5462 [Sarocladium strictum]
MSDAADLEQRRRGCTLQYDTPKREETLDRGKTGMSLSPTTASYKHANGRPNPGPGSISFQHSSTTIAHIDKECPVSRMPFITNTYLPSTLPARLPLRIHCIDIIDERDTPAPRQPSREALGGPDLRIRQRPDQASDLTAPHVTNGEPPEPNLCSDNRLQLSIASLALHTCSRSTNFPACEHCNYSGTALRLSPHPRRILSTSPPCATLSWATAKLTPVLAVLVVCVVVVYVRRSRSAKKSTTVGTSKQGFLVRLFGSWRSSGGQYQQTSSAEDGTASHALHSTNLQSQTNDAVNRNTSVRSVITLPAYRHTASHEERVLGYEGDRDGVDTIVDLPTAEEEEAMREREMETLYQIRQVRRESQAQRDEYRRLRDEARARNDVSALSTLRTRPRGESSREAVRELREQVERIKESRQRSVSSVSYAGLGITRHDGSRVRANSQESERMGLLSDAASMGGNRPGAQSPRLSHLRGRSASSIVSIDSDMPSPGLTRTNGSGSDTPRISNVDTRAGSSPELLEADLGDEIMRPPEYDDVPLEGDGLGSPYGRSTTPSHEPPPDYPGPCRSKSERSTGNAASVERVHDSAGTSHRSSRGVGGTPQLPSLRLSQLPAIVVEPSSATPLSDDERR